MKSSKAHLLVIDDDLEIRNVLHEFLSESYQCVAVNSAEEALVLLANRSFDLILSDITMDRMSGLEMVPYILNLDPQPVIVMISGQQTIEYAIKAMRAGAFDYITKPFDLPQVDAAVRRALDHRQLLEGKRKYENGLENLVKQFYSPDMNAFSLKRLTLESSLRRAVDNHEFVLFYQPQVDIRSKTIVGFEALIRWQHPEMGLLSPADFIPLAEDTGLIVPIGAWVLRTACAQTRRWQQAGFAGLRIAVNVSALQFQDRDFRETVVQTLRQTGLNPQYLELELTETSIMENADSAVVTMRRLREMGVKIAIDDFGTGYSSLSYLKRLPIDTVKLDQSFVIGATTDPDASALVKGIVMLAHSLRLKVIAEGVETEDELSFLKLVKCDEGQGYLFGKPAPANLFHPPAPGSANESSDLATELERKPLAPNGLSRGQTGPAGKSLARRFYDLGAAFVWTSNPKVMLRQIRPK